MKFRPVHEAFGAQVLDVDLSAPVPSEDVDELRGALDTYQLLLFRNARPIGPDRHVEVASWFGSSIDRSGDRPWGTMDNENAAGSYQLAFHSDHTYTDFPIKVISLHALELPPSGSTTSYVSGVYAWANLPEDLQEQLAGLTVRHKLRSEMNPDWPEFQADHPLLFVHPRTAQPVLFITESHSKEILGMDPEASERLITRLFGQLYAEDRIYVHQWQLFDFVIWDNLAVQHARTAEAKRSDGHRLLRRVALNEVSLEQMIERAREQERSRQLLNT